MALMHEETPPPAARTDRKLGEEWEDWDGQAGSEASQVPAGVFVGLSSGVVALWILGGWAVAWLVAPRFSSLHLGLLPWGAAAVETAGLLLWLGALGLGAFGVRAVRPGLRALGGIRWMIGPAVLLGRGLGVSRDRVGHAFVLLHNRLELLPPLISGPQKLLLLVPRCLHREIIQGLSELKEKYGFLQLTATGGTEARRAIAQSQPEGIIAVACERDLLAGVRDVKGRVPILAFSNSRPEGPCKNTRVNLKEIEDAVKLFLPRKEAR